MLVIKSGFFILSLLFCCLYLPLGQTVDNIVEDLFGPEGIYKNEYFRFELFIRQHNKSYPNLKEKAKRFAVFRENLQKIRLFNRMEQGSAVYGPTPFADLTYEEFKQKYLGFRPEFYSGNEMASPVPELMDHETLPKSFDWRDHQGVVSTVKNQEMCGSCWAFSATGNIEGVWAIKKNESVSLSEQELVDCDTFDNGCGGGLPTNAFKTVIRLGGIESESDYPYDAQNEKCHFEKPLSHVKIDSYVELKPDEKQIQSYLVGHGPVSIGINANAMQFYFGGISHPPHWLCNPDNLDHGVLIVGYGTGKTRILHKTQPYWVIKNSWGTTWGEKGYYRAYRGDDTCGLSRMASSAVVN